MISGLVWPGNALLAGSRDMHSNWPAVWVLFGDYTQKLYAGPSDFMRRTTFPVRLPSFDVEQ